MYIEFSRWEFGNLTVGRRVVDSFKKRTLDRTVNLVSATECVALRGKTSTHPRYSGGLEAKEAMFPMTFGRSKIGIVSLCELWLDVSRTVELIYRSKKTA